jgi:membrane fusion protein, multidrug efflux system
MNKRTLILFISGLLILLLILNKWQPWQKKQTAGFFKARGDAAVTVHGYVVKPGDVENDIVASGTIMANESVELKSEISGRVVGITFKEGSRVKKGDLLLRINDADLQAQLLRAEAQLRLATDIEKRQRKQLEIESISQEAYNTALNGLEIARAEVQLIKAQIEKSSIVAPFDGVIGLRYISEGSYIDPSIRIATLVDIDPVKIDFAIPERYLGVSIINIPIQFKIQGSAQSFSGRIYAVEPQIDVDIRSLRCRALCPNPKGILRPGAFAEIRIPLTTLKRALMLPSETLVPDAQQQTVFVAHKGRVKLVPIEIGLRTPDRVQVLSGLAAGDTVLTTGLLQVRPGVPVKVTELK